MDIVKILLSILETPDVKKPYENLKQYYKKFNKPEEAQAIEFLIQSRFPNVNNNSNNNQKQSSNNKKDA